MSGVELWVLVFVMLTPTGEIQTHEVDFFGNIDDCFITAEELVMSADDSRPWNWDFVCLEYDGNNT